MTVLTPAHAKKLRKLPSLLALALASAAPSAVADQRQAYSTQSPPWLRAVGKLQVPGNRVRDGRRRHHREDCSATLVARSVNARADTIVTAWHCLEFYNDLSKPITFTLPVGRKPAFSSTAYRLADGGGMHADWAILRLHQAVTTHTAPALAIHPQSADAGKPIIMAGYSRDSGLGEQGERLTFDPACRITGQSGASSDSNCIAYKGASGGPVVQLSSDGIAQLCGVVSQGDGAGVSTFMPVSGFRSAIDQALR